MNETVFLERSCSSCTMCLMPQRTRGLWQELLIVFLGFSWVKSKSLICRFVPRKASVLLFYLAEISRRRGAGGFRCGRAVSAWPILCLWDIFIPWNSAFETGVRPVFPWPSKCYHVLSSAVAVENLSCSATRLNTHWSLGRRQGTERIMECFLSCVTGVVFSGHVLGC